MKLYLEIDVISIIFIYWLWPIHEKLLAGNIWYPCFLFKNYDNNNENIKPDCKNENQKITLKTAKTI